MATAARSKTDRKEVARAYADQIVLTGIARVASTVRLGELAQAVSARGLSLTDLRRLLYSNPSRFAFHDRRWVPAARAQALNGTTAELIRRTLQNFAGPMPVADLALELAVAIRRSPEVYEVRLPQMLASSEDAFITESGFAGLKEWLFWAYDESVERALFVNGLDVEEAEGALKVLARVNFGDLDKVAKEAIASGSSVKAVGYAAWRKLNPDDPYAPMEYDAVALFDAILRAGAIYGVDGRLYSASDTSKWLKEALKDAEKTAPSIESEEAAPLEFSDDDIADLVKQISRSDKSFSVSKMLEERYEITAADRTYEEDLSNARKALEASPDIWFVGGDRFRRPDSAPEFIYAVPEFFAYPESEALDNDGQKIDVELSDDGFSSSLRKEMGHPLAMDVLDEDAQPKHKKLPEDVRCVLKSLHREIGTFPLCQLPTGWLPASPNIQELIFVDPEGVELAVWVNHEARLIFNLLDWWFEQPVESGAVFTLTKSSRPNVYEFAWSEETDPLTFISSERMEQLRDLAARAGDQSNYEILMDVLSHYAKGADYLTILAEANVVRRMTRRMVASILTGYHCFYQRSGSPVWHFDAKKVAQGFDKTKAKFVRK